ncbi:RNA polymerase sigma factor FliA [Poriferisphaera corsica]|uniref:RNA polymerase sigma factor n=1 Tax=Poriferisphaera corsica TaxID=2528020 RepID=A0A517YRE5_9BACT|nr:FliA/WhiG family RNA polymerase sigma factor [Poriferisphaera corsica]QDU32798.1 RNA polymerase sigma factor FliA [Poriferisphaera corsica]
MSRTEASPSSLSTITNENVDEVWKEYKSGETEFLRNKILEHYLPLVKYIAERVHSKLPNEVDCDDLISAGIFGLMDAIDAFDLSRGIKFQTYCAPRIRGAILDGLRAMDWVPRLVRSRTNKVGTARTRLQMQMGRKPTHDEIAEEMDISMEEYDKIRKDSSTVGVTSLDRKFFETDSSREMREIDVLIDRTQENPMSAAQRKDLKSLISKGLSRAERLILILYYFEEMTMKEIGTTLDLSESRVSQMHASVLARLRAGLAHRSGQLYSELD